MKTDGPLGTGGTWDLAVTFYSLVSSSYVFYTIILLRFLSLDGWGVALLALTSFMNTLAS